MNDPNNLRARAERWHVLAGYVTDTQTITAIRAEAGCLEAKAAQLEAEQMDRDREGYPPATPNRDGNCGK